MDISENSPLSLAADRHVIKQIVREREELGNSVCICDMRERKNDTVKTHPKDADLVQQGEDNCQRERKEQIKVRVIKVIFSSNIVRNRRKNNRSGQQSSAKRSKAGKGGKGN